MAEKEDYTDYEICRKRKEEKFQPSNLLDWLAVIIMWPVLKIFPDKMRTEECIVRRTEKSKGEVGEYYKEKEYIVIGISECIRTKNQEVPII